MKNRLDQLQRNLTILRRFISFHPCELPDTIISLGVDPIPHITIHCSLAPDSEGRDKVLSLVGDSYARDSWIAEPDHYEGKFNWKKDLDGVRLKVLGAADMPKFVPSPVPPNAFPLLLGNVLNLGQDEDEDSSQTPAF